MDNIVLERVWKRNGPLCVECIDGNLYTGEEQAHTFRITGRDEHGTATPITGTITGKFLRADNLDVPLVGSLDGGVAVLTLTEQCYDCRGRYVLSIFADDGEHKICIYCGTGNVFRTDGEGTIDPGNIIQDVSDLIDRIQTAIGQIPADYSALTARVTQTETGVSDLKSALGTPSLLEWTHNGDGKYIATNVTTIDVSSPYATSGSYRGKCAFIECSPGDVFIVTLAGTGNTFRPYVFCGSDGTILFASDNVEFDSVRIIAPENAAYVGFNSNSTGIVQIGETKIAELENEVGIIGEKVASLEEMVSGTVSASDVSRIKPIPKITDFEKIATDKRANISGLSTYAGYDVYCVPVGDAKIIQIFGTDSSNPWYGNLNASYRLVLEKTDGTRNYYGGDGNAAYARPVNDEYLVLVQNGISKLYVNVKQGTEETVLVYTDNGFSFRYDRNAVRLSTRNTIKSMIYGSAGSLNTLGGAPFTSNFSFWKYVHAGDSVVIYSRPSGVSSLGWFIGDGTETREIIAQYAIAYYVAPENGYVNIFTNIDNISEPVFIPHDNANYNFLSGKKITFLGDSITYRWQWEPIVLAFCGGAGYNCGIGSTPLSGSSENAFWQDVRLNAVKATDPDMVVILGGANDTAMNPNIGTDANLVDKDTDTFIGAYSYIVDNLLTWKPSLKIVILSTTYTKASNIGDFAAASKLVAEYYHLTYVDIFNHSGFNAYTFGNTSETQIYSTDRVHPNSDGYRIMASIVIAKLRECYLEAN